jgi:hypothetical protein
MYLIYCPYLFSFIVFFGVPPFMDFVWPPLGSTLLIRCSAGVVHVLTGPQRRSEKNKIKTNSKLRDRGGDCRWREGISKIWYVKNKITEFHLDLSRHADGRR